MISVMYERFDRLVWDEWNIEHAAKYGVAIEEIESVFSSEPIATESYKSRLLLIGMSSLGRMVAVVVGYVPNAPNVGYVFSARPASRRERRRYAQLKEGQPS